MELPQQQHRGTYLWAWGAGYQGQLGMIASEKRSKQKCATSPMLLQFPHPVRQVACGGNHTLAVTDDGSLYQWGNGTNEMAMVNAPGIQNIVKVACGQQIIVAINDKGQLFVSYAPRTITKTTQMKQFAQVHVQHENGDRFVDVSCGDRHAAAVTLHGVLYTFGSNEHGQLGYVRNKSDGDTKAVIDITRSARAVSFKTKPNDMLVAGEEGSEESYGPSASLTYSTSNNNLTSPSISNGEYGGSSSRGSSSNGNGNSSVVSAASGSSVPAEIMESTIAQYGQFITSVSCGAIHTACVTHRGEVFIFGFGEHLLQGKSKRCFFFYPVKVEIRDPNPIIQVASGQGHVVALTSKGQVYFWGSSEHGHLGGSEESVVRVPKAVLTDQVVSQVAAGRYHSMALTVDGFVYSWGSGENGQLGHGKDENVTKPTVSHLFIGSFTFLSHISYNPYLFFSICWGAN